MKFEDVLIVGFLLALFFSVSHDAEYMGRDGGANFSAGIVHQRDAGDGAALLKTRHAN